VQEGRLPVPVAVFEAKKKLTNVAEGLQQAETYRRKFNVPFVFSSNGNLWADASEDRDRILDNLDLLTFPNRIDLGCSRQTSRDIVHRLLQSSVRAQLPIDASNCSVRHERCSLAATLPLTAHVVRRTARLLCVTMWQRRPTNEIPAIERRKRFGPFAPAGWAAFATILLVAFRWAGLNGKQPSTSPIPLLDALTLFPLAFLLCFALIYAAQAWREVQRVHELFTSLTFRR
jgi:hypothetical protein